MLHFSNEVTHQYILSSQMSLDYFKIDMLSLGLSNGLLI